MSQGPILVVSNAGRHSIARALDDAQMFPVIEANFAEASHAVAQIHPAAVLVAMAGLPQRDFDLLARQTAARKPYVPLIAVDPAMNLAENALPLWRSQLNHGRLVARLRAALRVRALHATVLRRLGDKAQDNLPEIDPPRDATALLIGRGGNYPALSVALGERMGVVGALSIEAAANHLNSRDIDGIVLGEGFTPRVIDAFLTVLSEDSRFRNLPITVTSRQLARDYDLANLEAISAEPGDIAVCALPLIRQHAFEAQLNRTLNALDADGLLDPRTGLLTSVAFARDFTKAVKQTLSAGGGLSVARFAFEPRNERALLDGARIVSRLKRRSDFAAAHHDGSVLVVFSNTHLRDAHAIARRLSSVMRHSSHGRRTRSDAVVTVATLLPSDTPKSLLARLYNGAHREAM
jgi:GGDEF domain-containing protein